MMKLILLLYVPRSGSTFFSRQLAKRFSNILVLPEMRLPKLLLGYDGSAMLQCDELVQIIRSDHQFSSLGLTESEVVRAFENETCLTAEKVLLTVARMIAVKREADYDAAVFKCGSAGLWWPSLKNSYPNAVYIHVYRDVRAVVNSALHTERPYHPGQKMGRGDPWFRAAAWSKYVLGMHGLVLAGEPIYEISYERMCADTDIVFSGLAGKLNVTHNPAATGNGFSVADTEHAIHENINKSPLVERTDAWHDELKPWQGVVSEYLAAEGMRKLGYDFIYNNEIPVYLRYLLLFFGYVFHLYAMLRFKILRLVPYLVSPQRIIQTVINRKRTRHLRSRW